MENTHKYDFSHLIQPSDQNVGGPVQDDEALLLYALVRCMRIRRITEIGGLNGYSARNFLKALQWETDGAVYTIDLNPVASQGPNHFTYAENVANMTPEHFHGKALDMVFFDAHVFEEQMTMFHNLTQAGIITDATLIALHDTGLHPYKTAPWSYPLAETEREVGFVHQPVERLMVNELRSRFGYDAICVHMLPGRSDATMPVRHGLTLMRKFSPLAT